jgi:flagellar biosynthesis protein FlhF
MRIKTYVAADLATALASARAEVGPDALVLETKEVRGRLGLSRVEITVAVDRPNPGGELGTSPPRAGGPTTHRKNGWPTPAERPAGGLVRGSAELSSSPASSDRVTAGLRPAVHDPAQLVDFDGLNPALRTAVDTLVRSGLSQDLALRFARIASTDLQAGGDGRRLAAAAERAMERLVHFAPTPTRPRVLFVVGPPGAGKTTTAAKLAGRIARRGEQPVILAQADTDRVGANEQACLYSSLLGLRFAPVSNPDDLGRIVRGAQREATLVVDTSGIGSADGDRLRRLAQLRRVVASPQMALLVPAGLHRDEARRVLERFEPVRPTCVALSKVDDGGCIGELVTAIAPTRLPLAFLTNGHRVPDHLVEASPRRLAALLLQSGFRSSPQQEMRS